MTPAALLSADVAPPATPSRAARRVDADAPAQLSLPLVAPVSDRTARRFYAARAVTRPRPARPVERGAIGADGAARSRAPVRRGADLRRRRRRRSRGRRRRAPASRRRRPPRAACRRGPSARPLPVTALQRLRCGRASRVPDALGLVTRPAPLNAQAARAGDLRRDRAWPSARSAASSCAAWSTLGGDGGGRPALGAGVRDAARHLRAARADRARSGRRGRRHQPDLGGGGRTGPCRLSRLPRRERRRADDAAHAGADPRQQLRGPRRDAGRALRLCGRRGRLGDAGESERAVESGGGNGARQ